MTSAENVPTAPTSEASEAVQASLTDETLRDLAKEIAKSGQLGYDPTTLVKGTIVTIDHASAPPNVAVQLSGETSTTVASVRLLNNYSPVVGHTVIVARQGADVMVLGHVADLGGYSVAGGAGGWIKASINSGSHNGNSNGDIYYRRILDHGSWKMQWRGGLTVGGSSTVITGLPAEYRPTGHRSTLAARQVNGATACTIDFHTDGRVVLAGLNATADAATVSGDIASAGGHSHSIPSNTASGTAVTIDGSTGSAGSHSHGVAIVDNGHSHGVAIVDNSHSHGIAILDNGHSHSTPSSSTGGTAVTIVGNTGNSPTDTITFIQSDSNANHNGVDHHHQLGNAHNHGISITDNSHTHSIPSNSTGLTAVTIDGSTSLTAVSIDGDTGLTAVTIDGDTASAGAHSHSIAITDNNHTHPISSSTTGAVGDHGHAFSGGSHSHAMPTPSWVSFNGVEYFL